VGWRHRRPAEPRRPPCRTAAPALPNRGARPAEPRRHAALRARSYRAAYALHSWDSHFGDARRRPMCSMTAVVTRTRDRSGSERLRCSATARRHARCPGQAAAWPAAVHGATADDASGARPVRACMERLRDGTRRGGTWRQPAPALPRAVATPRSGWPDPADARRDPLCATVHALPSRAPAPAEPRRHAAPALSSHAARPRRRAPVGRPGLPVSPFGPASAPPRRRRPSRTTSSGRLPPASRGPAESTPTP